MTLDNMMTMAKADRYTEDGRQQIEDARRYKAGEISEKTGLQKQPDGSWAPPKTGKPGAGKKTAEKIKNQDLMGYKNKAEYEAAKKQAEKIHAGVMKTLEKINQAREINNSNHFEEAGNKSAGESNPAPKQPKPSVAAYMKARDTVKQLDDVYKKQLEEYENGQRLRANGGGAILSPMYGLKPNDLSKNKEYQEAKSILERFEAKDSAPLTGDTKIRIKK